MDPAAVASLVACTSAPVPSALDQVKFDCMLTPFQSEVFTRDEHGIVVAVSQAGVHTHAGGELANSAIVAGKRGVHHAAREVETTVVQIAEQRPDVMDWRLPVPFRPSLAMTA